MLSGRAARPPPSFPRKQVSLNRAPAPGTSWADATAERSPPCDPPEGTPVKTCGLTLRAGGRLLTPLSAKADRKFIQELQRQDRRWPRWGGREVKGRPRLPEIRLPLYAGVFGKPARAVAPRHLAFRCSAAAPPRPLALPCPGNAQSPGGLAGSCPWPSSSSHSALAAAAKTPRHPCGTVFSSGALGGRCALSTI